MKKQEQVIFLKKVELLAMMPKRDRIPLELQHCYVEIHREEKNLTPLFNQIRNDCITEVLEVIEGVMKP
jgi:hypothetical protein